MDKPTSLEDIISQIKAKLDAVKPARRAYKRKPKPYEGTYTAARAASQKAYWNTVSGAWKHLEKTYRSRAKKRGEPSKWLITLPEWKLLWASAGLEMMPDGTHLSLFRLRGKGKNDAKIWRIEQAEPWILSNMVVLYKGNIRANGRTILQEDNEEPLGGRETYQNQRLRE